MRKNQVQLWRNSAVALLAIVCGLCLGLLYVQAQQCDPTAVLSSELRNRTPDGDGIIHVMYSFADPNITTEQKAAIENALSQWSGVSSSTKVRFDPAPPNTSGDLDFQSSTNQNLTGGCAGYDETASRVYYSPEWQQRAQASTSAGATVIAHEIGHYLGLDEAGTNPPQPTIMNNPVVGPNTNYNRSSQRWDKSR
jgi:hypothetical protein